jgi:hypothetical protein
MESAIPEHLQRLAHGQLFEYRDCHPQTGMLNAVSSI